MQCGTIAWYKKIVLSKSYFQVLSCDKPSGQLEKMGVDKLALVIFLLCMRNKTSVRFCICVKQLLILTLTTKRSLDFRGEDMWEILR